MCSDIPLTRPSTPLLDSANLPCDLRHLKEHQLSQLARELRQYLLYCVGQTGGHFGAGLGVVELTIALHYVLNTPHDRIVWDVGHQTYPHKVLTGRREQMLTMRQYGGLAGFPKRSESEYDTFGVGHSSTSISAALGMALGSAQAGIDRQHVAIIGDGAMTAGMAFEALNHAAHTNTDLLVILNDNNMSISPNVGGLSTYLSNIWASELYNSLRENSKRVLNRIPPAHKLAKRTQEHVKGILSPGTLFEEIGFNYIGPIDGHDVGQLVSYLRKITAIKGPKLLHIITQKGKGFVPAENDPVGYHALTKIEPKQAQAAPKAPLPPKYQDVFGQWLCDVAERDAAMVAITPAMCEGSGMVEFAKRYPGRFFDVAIAEQHAVTLAAGMACEGSKPVVAIYSTFLQRAYDQLVHDVAIQNLDVTFGVDRAGLVGEDGPTHAGSFDISYVRCIPNMIIATPSNENECRQLLQAAYDYVGPSMVRYPRGRGTGVPIDTNANSWPIGQAQAVREGERIAILNFGPLLPSALLAASAVNAAVWDMRWAKPLDTQALDTIAEHFDWAITLEENTVAGGAGSGVSEYYQQQQADIQLLHLGLPDDFSDHGPRSQLLADIGLDAEGIERSIRRATEQ